jgi:hypothetical protein
MKPEHVYRAWNRYFDFCRVIRKTAENENNACEFIRVHGQTTVSFSYLPALIKKKLVSHIKRGYASASTTSYAEIYEFVCLVNPVHQIETGYMSSYRFRFPFLSGTDRSEFAELLNPFTVMSQRKQRVNYQIAEGIQGWYCLEGAFDRDIPAHLCKLVKPYLDKWRAERLEICKWLMGSPEPIVVPLDTQQTGPWMSPKLRTIL